MTSSFLGSGPETPISLSLSLSLRIRKGHMNQSMTFLEIMLIYVQM